MKTDAESELESESVTLLLNAWGDGDPQASDELVRLVLHDLRRLARAHMAGERRHHTLQPTALVHEVFLRLAEQPSSVWHDRDHFFDACTRLMRRILVDHARKQRAAKRGSGTPSLPLAALETTPVPQGLPPDDLLALDQALGELHRRHPRQARVVELRFFLGLKIDDVARVLDIAPRTVKEDWTQARAWLYRALNG